MCTEDRKLRAFPEGPGSRSSLVAIQSVQGVGGICILLSLGYTDGNETPGDLKTALCARGINSNNIHGGGLEGSSWGPRPLEARGPPAGL